MEQTQWGIAGASAVVKPSSCFLTGTWSNAGTAHPQDTSASFPRWLLLSNKLQRCSLNLHLNTWLQRFTDRSNTTLTDRCSAQVLLQALLLLLQTSARNVSVWGDRKGNRIVFCFNRIKYFKNKNIIESIFMLSGRSQSHISVLKGQQCQRQQNN